MGLLIVLQLLEKENFSDYLSCLDCPIHQNATNVVKLSKTTNSNTVLFQLCTVKPRSGFHWSFYVRRLYLSCDKKLKRNSDVKGWVLPRFHSSDSLIWMALWIELVQNRNRFVYGLLYEARGTWAHLRMNEYYCLPVHASSIFTGDLVSRVSHFPALWSGRGWDDEGPWEQGWCTDSFLIYMSCEWRACWMLLVLLSLSLCPQSDDWYLLSKIRRCSKPCPKRDTPWQLLN